MGVYNILKWVRTILISEDVEVRVAAIRILRHLTVNDVIVDVSQSLLLELLLIRCFDLDTSSQRDEQSQYLCYVAHLVSVCPSKISVALIKPVYSLAVNGYGDSRSHIHQVAAIAILCELVVSKSEFVCLTCGLKWLVTGIICAKVTSVSELCTTVLVYLLNRPEVYQFCSPALVLYELIGPLSDAKYTANDSEVDSDTVKRAAFHSVLAEQRKENILAVTRSLCVVLRSWVGLVFAITPVSSLPGGDSSRRFPLQSVLRALVACVQLKYLPVQDAILNLICQIFDFAYFPNEMNDWQSVLAVAKHKELFNEKLSTLLYDDFVIQEADYVLASSTSGESSVVDVVEQFLSFALLSFIDAGVIEALARSILQSDNENYRNRAIFVMANLLVRCSDCLPLNWRHAVFNGSNWLLLNDGASKTSSDIESEISSSVLIRQKVCFDPHVDVTKFLPFPFSSSSVCYKLEEIITVLRHPPIPISLQLTVALKCNIDQVAAALRYESENVPEPANSKLSFVHVVKESRVAACTFTDASSWEWSYVETALLMLSTDAVLQKTIEAYRFVKRLTQFYIPSKGVFCKLTDDFHRYSMAGCHLVEIFALASPENAICGVLVEFLTEINNQLDAVVQNRSEQNTMNNAFSLRNLQTSFASRDYFVFLGLLAKQAHGREALEREGTAKKLLAILQQVDCSELYVKLIVSSFDYTVRTVVQDENDVSYFPHELLLVGLKNTPAACRLYCTKYMGLLGRLEPWGFSKWGPMHVAYQLQDSSREVVSVAFSVLSVLLHSKKNVDMFANFMLKNGGQDVFGENSDKFEEYGDAGILVESKIIPLLYERSQYAGDRLCNRLSFWRLQFNTRYVRILEEKLHESLSDYRTDHGGKFSRRSNTKAKIKPCHIMPHLYGEMTKSDVGCSLLVDLNEEQDIRGDLMQRLVYGTLDTDCEILEMKAVCLALGHICSSNSGIHFLNDQTVIPRLVRLTEECPVASVSSCAFIALSLTAQCTRGASVLNSLGWEVIGPNYSQCDPDTGDTPSATCSPFGNDRSRVGTGDPGELVPAEPSFSHESGTPFHEDAPAGDSSPMLHNGVTVRSLSPLVCDTTEGPSQRKYNTYVNGTGASHSHNSFTSQNNHIKKPILLSMACIPDARMDNSGVFDPDARRDYCAMGRAKSECVNSDVVAASYANTVNHANARLHPRSCSVGAAKVTSESHSEKINRSASQKATAGSCSDGTASLPQSRRSDSVPAVYSSANSSALSLDLRYDRKERSNYPSTKDESKVLPSSIDCDIRRIAHRSTIQRQKWLLRHNSFVPVFGMLPEGPTSTDFVMSESILSPVFAAENENLVNGLPAWRVLQNTTSGFGDSDSSEEDEFRIRTDFNFVSDAMMTPVQSSTPTCSPGSLSVSEMSNGLMPLSQTSENIEKLNEPMARKARTGSSPSMSMASGASPLNSAKALTKNPFSTFTRIYSTVGTAKEGQIPTAKLKSTGHRRKKSSTPTEITVWDSLRGESMSSNLDEGFAVGIPPWHARGMATMFNLCLPVDPLMVTRVSLDYQCEEKRFGSTGTILNSKTRGENRPIQWVQQVPTGKHRCLKCEESSGPDNLNAQNERLRKELFKWLLCLSVKRKQCENQLLKMKQLTPKFFSQVCVYCDVCNLYLNDSNLDVSDRRFVQELFGQVDLTSIMHCQKFSRFQNLTPNNTTS